MNDKWNAWSEGQGSSATADDATTGLGDDGENVNWIPTRNGIVLLSNCGQCGRQWKGREDWGQVAIYFMRQKQKLQPGQKALWKYTRQGVMTLLLCNACGKTTNMLTTWANIQEWVDCGVRGGSLNPRILAVPR